MAQLVLPTVSYGVELFYESLGKVPPSCTDTERFRLAVFNNKLGMELLGEQACLSWMTT